MRPPVHARFVSSLPALLLVWLLALPDGGVADEIAGGWPEDGFASDAHLSGREIYDRVLDNRLHSYIQDSQLVSGDRAGSSQTTEVTVHYQSYQEEDRTPVNGIHSKTRLEYTKPTDMRYTSYLVIDNEGRTNDQFVYLPTYRRVRRVNLRGESLFGSDFSFEDILPREMEDADYVRKPDELVGGVACYAVEAVPRASANSEYSQIVFLVEKERYVPLEIRYWNAAGVMFKRMNAEHASIQKFDDAWLPMRSTMRNLLEESWSHLQVVKLDPNPEISNTVFSLRRLEGR